MRFNEREPFAENRSRRNFETDTPAKLVETRDMDSASDIDIRFVARSRRGVRHKLRLAAATRS